MGYSVQGIKSKTSIRKWCKVEKGHNKTNKLVIYMHIPKTGGGTLNSILKKQYQETEVVRNGGFWETKRAGKITFRIKKCKIFNVLEVISHLEYMNNFQKHLPIVQCFDILLNA